MLQRDKGENPPPKGRSGFRTGRQCHLPKCSSCTTSVVLSHQNVYTTSFLTEKPQTTFCGLMSHQDFHEFLQQLGRDKSSSEERAMLAPRIRQGKKSPWFMDTQTPSPPHSSFRLYKCSMDDRSQHWLCREHTAWGPEGQRPSLLFPTNQQKLGISQYLINFAPCYHVETWGGYALRPPFTTIQRQKGSRLSPCCSS